MMIAFYEMQEKITIRDTTKLPRKVLRNIAQEIPRMQKFMEKYGRIYRIEFNAGKGWEEINVETISRRSLMRVLRRNKCVAILIDYCYDLWEYMIGLEAPGFFLQQYLKEADDSLFDNLSFELYSLDNSDVWGSIFQIYKREDGTIFKGEPEYEEISEIPDAFWDTHPETLCVSTDYFTKKHDTDALNAAAARLNATEYDPAKKPYDFNKDHEEVFIYQAYLDTADERREFLDAVEEMRVACGGEMFAVRESVPGFERLVEAADRSTGEVRILRINIDRINGGYRFYMTRPIPA